MGSRTGRFALLATVVALLGLGSVGTAAAATGDVLADIAAPAGGVSVAFDGTNLYYTDRNGTMLHSVAPNGTQQASVAILGAPGINAITYDATQDVFWGVDSTGLGVYRIERSGLALLQFALVPALDLPGLCDVLTGCSTTVTGLAFDASTASLWFAPQGTQRVYHVTTGGHLLGWFDTNDAGGTLFPDCAANGVSGIAAAKSSLYLTGASCPRGFQFGKSDTQAANKIGAFPLGVSSPGDVECDDRSFPATVLWVRDRADGHLRAVETASSSCVFGGGVATSTSVGWISGGGRGEASDATGAAFPISHGLHLLCGNDLAAPSNNMVVNWTDPLGNKGSFKLEEFVTPPNCEYIGDPSPPPCTTERPCFNSYMLATGKGRLRVRNAAGQNLVDCASCGFIEILLLQDNGEPNHATDPLQPNEPNPDPDRGEFVISDGSLNPEQPVPLIAACGCQANYQTHSPH